MASTFHQGKVIDTPKVAQLEHGKARTGLAPGVIGRPAIARASNWRTQPRPQPLIDHEKTSSLLILAAEILSSEEDEKKKLAAKLQEDLAQTLTAIRFSVERGLEKSSAGEGVHQSLLWTISALQAAIKQVQALATELRPCGLDDFGLLPTLRLFCREYEQNHPGIRIEERMCVQPNYAFGPLAIVIYRVIESAFVSIAQFAATPRISLSLLQDDRTTVLTIEADAGVDSAAGSARINTAPNMNLCFASVRARTALSGGSFSVTHNKAGGITLRANWAL